MIAVSIVRQAVAEVNPAGGGGPDSEAGVIVEQVDHPGQRSVVQGDLGAVDLPQVIGRIAFESSPAGITRRCARGAINESRCSTRWMVDTAAITGVPEHPSWSWTARAPHRGLALRNHTISASRCDAI